MTTRMAADTPESPGILPVNEPDSDQARFRSISCISDNPLLLHRLCRFLEQDGDTFVEVSYSAEDALHLMTYITFDVIITDCTTWQDEPNGVLKILRMKKIRTPVIYFTRERDPATERDAMQYGRIWFLPWGETSTVPEFDDLYRLICELVPLAAHRQPEPAGRP